MLQLLTTRSLFVVTVLKNNSGEWFEYQLFVLCDRPGEGSRFKKDYCWW